MSEELSTKNQNKLWIILVIIINFFGLLAIWYFGFGPGEMLAYNAPSAAPAEVTGKTANWQEFNDSAYPFSFRYPKGWEISVKEESPLKDHKEIIQVQVTVKDSKGAEFTFYNPSTDVDNENYELGDQKDIVTSSGIKFRRFTGPSKLDSAKRLYYAYTKNQPALKENSVTLRGESSNLTNELIDNLDYVIKSFKFNATTMETNN